MTFYLVVSFIAGFVLCHALLTLPWGRRSTRVVISLWPGGEHLSVQDGGGNVLMGEKREEALDLAAAAINAERWAQKEWEG